MTAPPVPPRSSGVLPINEHQMTCLNTQLTCAHWQKSSVQQTSSRLKTHEESSFISSSDRVPSPPPPLPPRQPVSISSGSSLHSSKEDNELLLVPPPPSKQTAFKRSQEMEDLIQFIGPHPKSNLCGISLDSAYNLSLLHAVQRQTSDPFSQKSSILHALGASSTANIMTKQSVLPLHHDIQHSRSAPDLKNFNATLVSQDHEIPVKGAVKPSLGSGNVSLKSAKNTSNMGSVFNYMKKKSDGNLIDLFCGSEENSLTGKISNSKYSKMPDDILSLFDPLTEPPTEIAHDTQFVVENSTAYFISEENCREIKNTEVVCELETSQQTFNEPVNINCNFVKQDKPETDNIEYCSNNEICLTDNKMKHSDHIILKVTKLDMVCCEEIEDFSMKLKILRSEFSYDDYPTNVGLVISPVLDSYQEDTLSVKLVISSHFCSRPVSFTCDVNTTIEHIISHAVCMIFDTVTLSMDNFVLKVHGLSEYFSADSALADYEYVHQCHKFDKPVHLTLVETQELQRPLARTLNDDKSIADIKPNDIMPSEGQKVISCKDVNILLETLQKEVEKIRECALSKFKATVHPHGVVQAVKAVCALFSRVETTEITEAVNRLIKLCVLREAKYSGNSILASDEFPLKNELPDEADFTHLLECTLQQLYDAVNQLLKTYSRTFSVDFTVPSPKSNSVSKDVTCFLDSLLFQISITHRIPPHWSSTYENFIVVCELWHGQTNLAKVSTTKVVPVTKSFFQRICFDEWIQFETVPMCTLPREAKLSFTLYGIKTVQADGKHDAKQQLKTLLGWCGLQLFNHRYDLAQGRFLLGLWPEDIKMDSGHILSNPDHNCTLLQISLPEFHCQVKFPSVMQDEYSSTHKRPFDMLDHDIQLSLLEIIKKDSLSPLKPEEKELLWEKRHYCYDFPQALPKVLLSAHGWDWACLADIYAMLHEWKPLAPVDALQLLLPCFPDIEVRQTAVNWMKNLVSDELCDYLPQIVQILRLESWEDSAVSWFLLERSLTSVRVAHHLYWLLEQNVHDKTAGRRMQLMLNSLLTISGCSFQERMVGQQNMLQTLSDVADKVKGSKESMRLQVLFHEVEIIHHSLAESPTCLPLSPSLEVCGVDVKSCSYFTSNTLPLKLVFRSLEEGACNIEAIYKVGDDLRQDMLTLQMIGIMNKLWLKEGVDLKIVTFLCISTGLRKGMVEMVSEAETLRKIQTEHGLTGSFKDRPIAEWLQKHNTSELEYQQAVKNFTLSCAGYCVATYILGICDRHNDNIMLKTSGHIFHIDFGRFLGDAQMFGSIKRDRTPFVLTSDMAYVINGGDKPSKKFHNFIDLCSQAFNIIRKHSNIFITLFTLMVSSGIPGVSNDAVGYVKKALLPGLSETEAAVQFTRMIQESLKSWFIQFNFFIHNLAQLRFTGDHNDGLLLSFIPKTFTKEMDGKIISTEVVGYEKKYDSEKYYTYIIKVKRENVASAMHVFRTYREFVEFQQKLCMMFPLAKFHSLPRSPIMGRSNVRDVAEKRKLEVSIFLKSLKEMADEISHCNLVYTFFHPLLRDQEGLCERNSDDTCRRRQSSVGLIQGQVKLSITYKNNNLFVMVMHAKNLVSSKGSAPDPYVKAYLLPDPTKATKRKTKVMFKNCHPTFMEVLVFQLPCEVVQKRDLHISVWNYDRVQENEFLGAAVISLEELNLSKETVQWYPLGSLIR